MQGKEDRLLEIVVVDNASEDKTPEMLDQTALENENIKILLNKENRGFAGGNNDGVAISGGDIIVLLNSDTLAPSGSITRLGNLLCKHPDWGLLGPATNEAGNEQKIYTTETEPHKVIKQGLDWRLHSNGDYFESERLDFCCVAMKKQTYEDLGGLDENFGMGYYEDTDFSIRAAKAGYRMIFTEEVFIYHKAGKSFSKHGKKAVKRLMRANRKKLIRKHSGDFTLHPMRDQNLKVMQEYAKIKDKSNDKDFRMNLAYRFDRRMKMAKSMYPNNILKKMPYYFGLQKMVKQFSDK